MDSRKLGNRIKTARKEKKLTSEKLAELCNLNATYLRQIESGLKVPSLPVFVVICEQLQVSPNFLLTDSLKIRDSGEKIQQLLREATPGQTDMILSMIECAIQNL